MELVLRLKVLQKIDFFYRINNIPFPFVMSFRQSIIIFVNKYEKKV